MIRLAAILFMLASPALACGPDSDCRVGARSYRLHLPPAAADGPVGALLFAHGYRGSAAGEMRNAALRQLADDLGLALVALKSAGEDWNLAHRPAEPGQKAAREAPYVAAVLDDLAGHIALDESRLVLAGFSAGGMLTWTMACEMGDRFRGFVPMSGTFWAPVPDRCAGPAANLVHLHGTEDRTVPLAGRAIGPTRQGDVAQALATYAAAGGYTRTGDPAPAPGGMTCASARNPAAKLLQICTFAGGHDFSTQRLRHGVETVLAAP